MRCAPRLGRRAGCGGAVRRDVPRGPRAARRRAAAGRPRAGARAPPSWSSSPSAGARPRRTPTACPSPSSGSPTTRSVRSPAGASGAPPSRHGPADRGAHGQRLANAHACAEPDPDSVGQPGADPHVIAEAPPTPPAAPTPTPSPSPSPSPDADPDDSTLGTDPDHSDADSTGGHATGCHVGQHLGSTHKVRPGDQSRSPARSPWPTAPRCAGKGRAADLERRTLGHGGSDQSRRLGPREPGPYHRSPRPPPRDSARQAHTAPVAGRPASRALRHLDAGATRALW